MENLVRFDPTTPDGMLAQLVERALSMCKVRSSTLLHSTIFFLLLLRCWWCFARRKKQQTTPRLWFKRRRQIYDEFKRERGAGGFFFLRTNSFSYAKSPFYNWILRRATYYYYVPYHTCVLPSIIISISIIHTILHVLYLSRVVLFDVPVAQKRRHSERKVGWIFFYVKLEIFLQTFRLFLPGRVVFVQRNRTLRLVVVKQ